MTGEEVIAQLGLAALPGEGGFFRETYRSALTLGGAALPDRFGSTSRSAATAIYYLLTADTYSALHRLRSDEVYHFYRGDPVEQFQLDADGKLSVTRLGSRFEDGEQCQAVVPAGVWQGSRLCPGGAWALLGTTVAPGFEYADCEFANADLLAARPELAATLRPLLARR